MSDESRSDDETSYESGARKPLAVPEFHQENPVHTGDPADEPKEPYGLTEPLSDRGSATRHYDGVQPSHAEAADHHSGPAPVPGSDDGAQAAPRPRAGQQDDAAQVRKEN